MREIKFRAWAEHTIDLRFDYAYKKSREEYKDREPSKYNEEQWDKWYQNRDDRLDDLLIEWDNNHDKSESKIKEKGMTTDILVNGKITRPINYEIIEIMQYTGLKDKNDIEIYEGDIIQIKIYAGYSDCYGLEKFTIKYEEGNKLGKFVAVDKDNSNWNIDNSNEILILGNIYENPELLEVE
jgi:uncharacterized phage protein (TIGR01671 family)